MQTAHQVLRTLRAHLIGSPLAKAVSGGVYYDGTRPRDSRREDIVLIFTEADAREVQQGTVTVLIFFPDIAPWTNGVFVEDGARAEALERLALAWAESLTADKTEGYLFRLKDAPHTLPEPETHEHFVSLRLAFKHY